MSADVDFVPTAHRPGLRAWVAMLGAELRSVVRDTSGLLIPLGLPVLLLTMYGLNGVSDAPGVGAADYLEAYGIPLAVVMVLTLIGVVNMPSFLATYRKTGVLRRLGVTPVGPMQVLLAQVATSVIQSLAGIALALAVAFLGFGAGLPEAVWTAVGVVVLTAAAMYGLGMIVAAVSPTPNAAVAIGMVVFFGIGALGGMFGPVDVLPEHLAEIGSWLPFAAGSEALRSAWGGVAVASKDLLTLAGFAAVGLAVGVRTFRWDG